MSVLRIEDAVAARAARLLVGRRVEQVVFAPRAAARRLGWSMRPPMLILTGGVALYPARDGRGENAGAFVIDHDRLIPPMALEEFIPRAGGDRA